VRDKWDFYKIQISIIMKMLTQKSSFLSFSSHSLSLSSENGSDMETASDVLSREDKSVSERKIKLSDQWVLTAAGDATIRRRGEKYLVRETCCRWRRTMHTNRSCLSRQLCLGSSRGRRWVRGRNKSSASWSSLGTSEEESDSSFTNRTRP